MLLRWALVAILSTLTSSAAMADPIIASFDVQIWYRYSYVDQREEVFLSSPFKLTVSFDPGVINSDYSLPQQLFEEYGAPTFSSIPLDVPTRPSNLPLIDGGRTVNQWYLQGDEGSTGPYTHYADIGVHTETDRSLNPAAEYRRGLSLGLSVGLFPTPGPLSPTELVDYIGHPIPTEGRPPQLVGEELNFTYFASYFTSGAAGGFDPSSYAYYGVAQITSNPVPEPATIALVALGLAGIGARRWRQRKT
jgi:hypothetical protein